MEALVKKALFYEGPWYALSNFSSFAVEWNGHLWSTAEHAYQAAKFTDPAIATLIREARSAHEAKKIGHDYGNQKRHDWYEVRLSIMEEILWKKVEQHPYVKERLLSTDDAELVEDSPQDEFWARGKYWKGQNQLGKLWMKIRAQLRTAP
jgi:ribA/ribD-fused uncharacterized protein